MSGTSKAVLSICVLLLAGLVVYYGITPSGAPQLTVGDLPSRMQSTEVRMFSRDLEAAAAALGIAPAIVEIAIEPVSVEEVAEVEPEPDIALDQENPPEKERMFYTVVSGDTLGEIAFKLLGSSKYAINIATLNMIDDPRTIQLGRTLRIPALRNPTSNPMDSSPSIPENTTTHVIQDGETLSDIAFAYLGSAHKWMEIWEANKSRLSSPDRLKVGMSIVIP